MLRGCPPVVAAAISLELEAHIPWHPYSSLYTSSLKNRSSSPADNDILSVHEKFAIVQEVFSHDYVIFTIFYDVHASKTRLIVKRTIV